MKQKIIDKIFTVTVKALTVTSVLILIFIIIFIVQESMVFFSQVFPLDFLLGRDWRPMSQPPRVGLLPILTATLALSGLALLMALPAGIGCSLFLSQVCPLKLRRKIRPFIDVLAGIPSVVYGFVGVVLLLPTLEGLFNLSSGDSLLAGGIVLAVMILPFLIATITESMENTTGKHIITSKSMGVSRWYMILHLVLPASRVGILAGAILGTARAMGETMAVIMVVGNSPLMPASIWQRVKPIPSLIALEMGSAPLGTLHYHALYAAGLVLLLMLLLINMVFYYIRKKIEG
ncbi:MAG: phosphate ABC transporter permease subunit PstC [Candidatus Syntrophonatronum acetioxidans]|uniref:Phosphate transport system permease protein n=1 Tax=Candidatus Syntrophonatronum acetioxidans TaxID=1795816 RepID=A0A424YFZ6_9FIRM|nr:MAG: phosphate ABC transporter permease subunit PstC [Candidatus Syntrophonatronum acetioxidans]